MSSAPEDLFGMEDQMRSFQGLFALASGSSESLPAPCTPGRSSAVQGETAEPLPAESSPSERTVCVVPALTHDQLKMKVCAGCDINALTKSPVCRGDYREWSGNSNEYYGPLCRPCGALVRLRYPNMTNQMASAWINKKPEHKEHFQVRLIAWFTLKMDASCQRINMASLEARVTLLRMLQEWRRTSSHVGVPRLEPVMLHHLFEEYVKSNGNPFLRGGLATMMVIGGQARLGVAIPAALGLPQVENAVPLLNQDASDLSDAGVLSKLSEIMVSPDMCVSSQDDREMFETFSREWVAVSSAKVVAAGSPAAEGQTSGEMGTEKSCTRIVKYTGSPVGTDLSVSAPVCASGAAPSNSFDGRSASSKTSATEVGHDRDPGSPAAKKARKVTALRRKIDSLVGEMSDKLDAMQAPSWKTDVLERAVEGLSRRMENARETALNKQSFDDANAVGASMSDCKTLHSFLLMYKKTAGKSDSDAKLLELAGPLQELRECMEKRSLDISSDLVLLHLRCKFLTLWRDGQHRQAFQCLDLKVVSQYGKGVGNNSEAMNFVFPIMEKAAVDHLRTIPKLCTGAKFQQQAPDLQWIVKVCRDMHSASPDFPRNSDNFDSIARRASVFVDQLDAVANLLVAITNDAENKPIVPSALKDSVATIMSTPLTKIGHAMSTYLGPKMVWDHCRRLTTRTAADDAFLSHVATSYEDATMSTSIGGCNLTEWVQRAVTPCQNNLFKLVELLKDLSRIVLDENRAEILQLIDAFIAVVNECGARFRQYVHDEVRPACDKILNEFGECEGDTTLMIGAEARLCVQVVARDAASKAEVARQVLGCNWQAVERFTTQLRTAVAGPVLTSLSFCQEDVRARSQNLEAMYKALTVDYQHMSEDIAAVGSAASLVISDRMPLDQALTQYDPRKPDFASTHAMKRGDSPIPDLALLAKRRDIAVLDTAQKHVEGSPPAVPPSPLGPFFVSNFVTKLLKLLLFEATAPFVEGALNSKVLRSIKTDFFGAECDSVSSLLYDADEKSIEEEMCKFVEDAITFDETWTVDGMDHMKLASCVSRLQDMDITGTWLVSDGQFANKEVFVMLVGLMSRLVTLVYLAKYMSNKFYDSPDGISVAMKVVRRRSVLIWGTVALRKVLKDAIEFSASPLCTQIKVDNLVRLLVSVGSATAWMAHLQIYLDRKLRDIMTALALQVSAASDTLQKASPTMKVDDFVSADNWDKDKAQMLVNDKKTRQLEAPIMMCWNVLRDASRDATLLGFDLSSHECSGEHARACNARIEAAQLLVAVSAGVRVLLGTEVDSHMLAGAVLRQIPRSMAFPPILKAALASASQEDTT